MVYRKEYPSSSLYDKITRVNLSIKFFLHCTVVIMNYSFVYCGNYSSKPLLSNPLVGLGKSHKVLRNGSFSRGKVFIN